MSNISDKLFKQHILENTLFPQPDSNQFMAYLILSQKYPALTYWSMDGYSCDALADYEKGLVWDRNSILDWTTKEVIGKTSKSFWECSTPEIVDTWMKVNGETTKTKKGWLLNIFK